MVQGTRIETSVFGVHRRNGGDLGADSINCEKMLNMACSEMRKNNFMITIFLDSKYMSFDLNLAFCYLTLPPRTPMFTNSRRKKESRSLWLLDYVCVCVGGFRQT